MARTSSPAHLFQNPVKIQPQLQLHAYTETFLQHLEAAGIIFKEDGFIDETILLNGETIHFTASTISPQNRLSAENELQLFGLLQQVAQTEGREQETIDLADRLSDWLDFNNNMAAVRTIRETRQEALSRLRGL